MLGRLSLKRAFIDLLYIKKQLRRLCYKTEKYQLLIDLMLSKEFLDSDESIPTLKQISLDLNLKPHSLSRLIKDLYAEVFNSENDNYLKFNKLEVYFDLTWFEGDRGYFKLKQLSFIP